MTAGTCATVSKQRPAPEGGTRPAVGEERGYSSFARSGLPADGMLWLEAVLIGPRELLVVWSRRSAGGQVPVLRFDLSARSRVHARGRVVRLLGVGSDLGHGPVLAVRHAVGLEVVGDLVPGPVVVCV